MEDFEKLGGDPKKIFQYLLTTLGVFIAMITLFIFTMGEELKMYFIILLVMLVLFVFLLMYLSPIIFADVKTQTEKVKEIIKEKVKENKEENGNKLKKD